MRLSIRSRFHVRVKDADFFVRKILIKVASHRGLSQNTPEKS
jgi:hypothetical protein